MDFDSCGAGGVVEVREEGRFATSTFSSDSRWGKRKVTVIYKVIKVWGDTKKISAKT